MIVSAIVLDAVRLPEVPLMVTLLAPTTAVLAAVKVTTLVPVAGFAAKAAVTPLGRPLAVNVTLPLKPFAPETVTVSEAVLPCTTDNVDAAGASVKLGGNPTVRAIVVVAVRLPDVPVMVTVVVPAAAVLLTLNVNRLEVLVGFVAKVAVTPLGRPLTARVVLPVKPFAGATLMVSVTAPPCRTDRVELERARVKVGAAATAKLRAT